jgi:hypothetical protein
MRRRWRRRWRRDLHRPDRLDAAVRRHRLLHVARPAGLGRLAASRMVSLPGNAARQPRSDALRLGRRLYRRADGHGAGAGAGSFLHLPDLHRAGERVQQLGRHRRLRRPPLDRPQCAAGLHHGGVRRGAGAGGGHRPRHRDPRHRHQRGGPQAGERHPRFGRCAGAQRRDRPKHCGPYPAAESERRRRHARDQRHQGEFRSAVAVAPLRLRGDRGSRPENRLHQPAQLHPQRQPAVARRLCRLSCAGRHRFHHRHALQWRRA